ncbi:non-reducing end alpha-L-arabinofuranosidase family hydrolase [Actinophytocola sp.]|uniref:non-reducing end alpha-L-arabinofuranosidase family hydrolase n=1 Tax=Actinophytocola sp. TaxID=1872138 RepID=UPI0039C875B0
MDHRPRPHRPRNPALVDGPRPYHVAGPALSPLTTAPRRRRRGTDNGSPLSKRPTCSKIRGQQQYLLLVKATGSDGKRHFRSWTTDRLDGAWPPLPTPSPTRSPAPATSPCQAGCGPARSSPKWRRADRPPRAAGFPTHRLNSADMTRLSRSP